MSSDPTTADALSTSQRHDPGDVADPATTADNEHPERAEPFVRAETAHADEHAVEHAAPELDAEAILHQTPMEDGPQGPGPSAGAPEEGVWAEAPATGNGLATSGFEMPLDADEMPQPLREAVAQVEGAAEDEGQSGAMTPLLEAITPVPQAQSPIESEIPADSLEADEIAAPDAPEPGEAWEPQPSAKPTLTASEGHALFATASAEVAPALETNSAAVHDASVVELAAPQDAGSAESARLTTAPEAVVTDHAPFDSPSFEPRPDESLPGEPAAGYPVQPTWAQQPTYADAQPWGQLPMYAEPAPPLSGDPPAVPWADSSYALPVYAPPPSGYAQPMAQPMAHPAAYAPAVYAPSAPLRQRRRWPLVLGTATAVLIVAALALVLATYGLTLFGRPLYQNSMTSVAGGWPDDAECHFATDGYHINSASNCYYSGADYRDVTITVTATLLKGDPTGAYGIAFRRPSPNNFYVFLITGNGKWLVLKNAVPLQQATANTALRTGIGALNKLSVHAQGSQFTFFANGVQLGSLSDGSYPNGKVGLAGDANTEAVFTDFTVARG